MSLNLLLFPRTCFSYDANVRILTMWAYSPKNYQDDNFSRRIIKMIILGKCKLKIGFATLLRHQLKWNWNTWFLILRGLSHHLTTYVHDPILETWPMQIKTFQFANHPPEMTAWDMREHMLVTDSALSCFNCILL